jgi:hypothetical protein
MVQEQPAVDVVAGVMPTREAAERAVADLRALGLPDEAIGLAVPLPGHYRQSPDLSPEAEIPPGTGTAMAENALAGAALGSLAGFGLIQALVPAVGNLGLGGALIGLVGGAAWGTFFGAYGTLYAKLRRQEGRERICEIPLHGNDVLVVARAGPYLEEAHTILHRHGARCFLEEMELDEESTTSSSTSSDEPTM